MSTTVQATDRLPRVPTLAEVQAAYDTWGMNCGPGALCAVTGMAPNQVRRHLGDFGHKRYTNPTMMAGALRSLRIPFRRKYEVPGPVTKQRPRDEDWPEFGLVRVQWGGPWTKPGVPMRVRYRLTHWIAVAHREGVLETAHRGVFDINAIAAGGWVAWSDWVNELVPWILQQCVPKADGEFWPTHMWEINRS